MHCHVPFLVSFVLTVVKSTVVLTDSLSNFLLAFTCFEKFYLVSHQFSVVVKSFLTIQTLKVLDLAMYNLVMLGQIRKLFEANVAEFLLWIIHSMTSLFVAVKIRLFGECLTAVVTWK